MNSELIVTGARIVTRDEEFTGTVRVREGRIVDVDRGKNVVPEVWIWMENILFPG